MGIGDGFGPIGPLGPIPGFEITEDTTVTDVLLYLSTLEDSDAKKAILSWLASSPLLAVPQLFSLSPEAFAIKLETKIAEIGAKLWDNYNEHLQEQAERKLNELKSPAYLAWLEQRSSAYIAKMEAKEPLDALLAIRSSTEYNMWLNSLPPEARDKELHFNRVLANAAGVVNGMNNFYSSYKDEADAVPFMAAAFVIAMSFMGSYMNVVDTVSTGMVGVNPIQDAATSLSQVLPPNLIESTILTVNLFAVGLIYYAQAETIAGLKPGDQPKDLNFARNYAEAVLNKVNSNQINQFLMAVLVHHLENGQPITPQRMEQLVNFAKLIMLSVALALLYKVETGWLTGQDFAGMIKENPYKEGSVEYRVIESIREYLGQLPSAESAKMLEALMAFFDRNPSVDDMLNPQKAFLGVMEEVPEQDLQG